MKHELTVNIPFAGFYESKWSGGIDREEEIFCENCARESDHETDEMHQPPELRLNERELSEILFRHTSYDIAYKQIARDYVDSFNDAAAEYLELKPGFRFESMTSPREYNFATDRIFCYVRYGVMVKLFRASRAEGHATLAAVIRRRFTSCSGFISHYRNDLDSWLDKPLIEWDHNELGTLLIAALERTGADDSDFEWAIYDSVSDREKFYHAWSESVDWEAFEKARTEARADKLAELADSDPQRWQELGGNPDQPPVTRCPYTLDMFAGMESGHA